MEIIAYIIAYPLIGVLLGVLDTLIHGKKSLASSTKYKAVVAGMYMALWPLMLCTALGVYICRSVGWALNKISTARN